jgi:DUF177 domain-containing protein
MKVLISDIPEEGLDLQLQDTVESDAITLPVRAQLRIEKVGSEVVVRGELITNIKLQCSRCLKDFWNEMSVPVNVVYHPIEELKGEEKYQVKGEELDMDFYSEKEMDMLTLMTEQVLLNIPMKPLCNDFCKGICLKCGKDLNLGSCNCSTKDVDPRLEVLKKFFDKE